MSNGRRNIVIRSSDEGDDRFGGTFDEGNNFASSNNPEQSSTRQLLVVPDNGLLPKKVEKKVNQGTTLRRLVILGDELLPKKVKAVESSVSVAQPRITTVPRSEIQPPERSKLRKINAPVTRRVMQLWSLKRFINLDLSRVQYRSRMSIKGRDGDHEGHYIPLASGRISRCGIKCDCCSKMFSVSAFEKHAAGSTNHDGQAPNFIYLEECQKSLMDCLVPLTRSENITNATTHQRSVKFFHGDICSFCHRDGDQGDQGGGLLMCDRCQSVYHPNCLDMAGLSEVVPVLQEHENCWLCPSCRCGVCGYGYFQEKEEITNEHEHGPLVVCHQCQTNYHAGCLGDNAVILNSKSRNAYFPQRKGSSNAYFFCSRTCEKIRLGLRKVLLEKPIPVDKVEGGNNLTWTMLKFRESGLTHVLDLAHNYTQLKSAMDMIQKCFGHAITCNQRDVAEGVILQNIADLRPFNFLGFYTVVLKRGSEVFSAATVRIHGGKVAEIPLIATKSQCRRHGMRKILMNELEKQLSTLGVERLTMPATSSVLHVCTNSLGFSKMTTLERASLVRYGLLDFPDTVMCHKFLKQSSSPSPLPSK